VCPNNYRQETVKENWYKEPGSLLAQTLQKKGRQKKNKKSNLLTYPKTLKKSRNPKEYNAQYGRQFYCWEKYPTD
jgi:hypothetical protein